jgi:hypothetical protein
MEFIRGDEIPRLPTFRALKEPSHATIGFSRYMLVKYSFAGKPCVGIPRVHYGVGGGSLSTGPVQAEIARYPINCKL